MAGGEDKRRETRYKARLALKLVRGRDVVALQTEDVSFRGVFLRMDAPPAIRQLVRLEVTLPGGATIRTHAMVVYRVEPGGEQTPGAGMQFYGLEGRERAQWEEFVQRVRDEAIVLTPSGPSSRRSGLSSGPAAAPASTPDPVRRKFERYQVRFMVRLSTVGELVELYTRDISKGGMALETDVDLPLGTAVGVELVHPDNGEMFELDAVVRRKIRQPDATGVAVEFVEMNETRRAQLERFIGAAAAANGAEGVVTVKAGDPKLA